MRLEISIYKVFAKPLLWITKFFNDNRAVVVCNGYGEDWDFYTGLYWDDDKNANLGDYQNYKLWLNI